jgi:antitoxin component of MazEF toxin-antitoxin module
VTVKGRILRWGNSYGLRLSRSDMERLRLRPDTTIEVKVDVTPGERISALDAVAFDLGSDATDRHDELFERTALDEHLESVSDPRDQDD